MIEYMPHGFMFLNEFFFSYANEKKTKTGEVAEGILMLGVNYFCDAVYW